MTGYANTPTFTISVDMLAGDMQATVKSVRGAPVAPFRVRMGSEWAVVCMTIDGTTPRLVFSERGTEGSTAAKHNKGTIVTHVVTAADLTGLTLAAGPQPRDYVRSPAARAYLASTFT
jgi:hypothetical protein